MQDENASTGSAAAPEQARRGVRNWVREAGRTPARVLRSASPYGILAFLTASAVAPVAGSGLGASGAFAAALDQLGNIGGDHLADVLSHAARRIHAERSAGRWREPGRWRDAIADALLPRLEAQDHEARALREEVGELLHAVDAVGVALTESTHADDELRASLTRAFGALGTDVAELRWMAADAARALATIQRDLTEQGRVQRQQIDLIRQSLMVTTLLRQDLLRGSRAGWHCPVSTPPSRASPAGTTRWSPCAGRWTRGTRRRRWRRAARCSPPR